MSLIDELIEQCEESIISCDDVASDTTGTFNEERRGKARSRYYVHKEYLVALTELKASA